MQLIWRIYVKLRKTYQNFLNYVFCCLKNANLFIFKNLVLDSSREALVVAKVVCAVNKIFNVTRTRWIGFTSYDSKFSCLGTMQSIQFCDYFPFQLGTINREKWDKICYLADGAHGSELLLRNIFYLIESNSIIKNFISDPRVETK